MLDRAVATTDLHQHLWPESLLAALVRRSAPPRLRRDAGGLILELAGEPPAAFSPAAHDPVARAAMAVADGIDRVVVAPSSPLGIESLPAAEARRLLDAFHSGILELGAPFELWGALAVPDAEAAEAVLEAGAGGCACPRASSPGRCGSSASARCWSCWPRVARRCSCTPGRHRPARSGRPTGGRR